MTEPYRIERHPEIAFSLSIQAGRELIRITNEGEVIAPSLEAASEAGRVFVEAMREHITALKPILSDTPDAWLVTGGRLYLDKVFINKMHAENSIAERKDGSRLEPLFLHQSAWRDIATCPKDGTIFDAMRDGIRYTDCRYDEKLGVVRQHGYPSSTTVFGEQPTHWMPRPDGLIQPYEINQYGEKYVP